MILESGHKPMTGAIRSHGRTYWYFAYWSCCQTIFLTFMFIIIYLCSSQLWSEKFAIVVGSG